MRLSDRELCGLIARRHTQTNGSIAGDYVLMEFLEAERKRKHHVKLEPSQASHDWKLGGILLPTELSQDDGNWALARKLDLRRKSAPPAWSCDVLPRDRGRWSLGISTI